MHQYAVRCRLHVSMLMDASLVQSGSKFHANGSATEKAAIQINWINSVVHRGVTNIKTTCLHEDTNIELQNASVTTSSQDTEQA